MITNSEISFPCKVSFFKEKNEFWKDAICLGAFQEGTTMSPMRNLVVFWLVVDEQGYPHKIYDLAHVRFTLSSNATS